MPKKSKKRATRGQGVIYPRNGIWWCDYSVDGARRRESCETKDRDEALAYLHRKQGRLASGESLTPDRVCVRDLLKLVLEDYEVRKIAQAYICTLKVNSILLPKLGDIKATKLSSARIKEYLEVRLKVVKAATINRELALLHRAFQLGYNHDPPPVARVPYFPKLTEGNPRKGFLKPESYKKLLFELPEELRLLFVVSYHVGLRKGALLRIKWSQVDLKTHTIWMDGRKKNRKPEPVAVPIYGDMVKFIQMQPQTSEYLFAPAANPIRDF